MSSVTLSDGQSCDVRRLRLFELREAIAPPLSGEWMYTVTFADGNEATAEFLWPDDIAPPERPKGEIPSEGTPRWFAWRDYEFYQAAQQHRKQKRLDLERYLQEMADYIMNHCISAADRQRVVTADDYDAIYHAAFVPQLTKSDLDRQAAHIFFAKFDDQPLLDALLGSGGQTLGECDVIAKWEEQVMIAMGKTEAEWSELSLGERARKVVAHNMDNWMGALQSREDSKRRGR